MNKEECERKLDFFINGGCNNCQGECDSCVSTIFKQLIEEHFDPKPYKFEDLKDGMRVWDDKNKDFKQISRAIKENDEIWCYGLYDEYRIGKFEENRFYPPSKANEGSKQ